MSIDYNQRIPNNVDLAGNRTLQRALEHWQPAFLDWWGEMGPENTRSTDIYLRTAVSVDRQGWAHYDYVKMPDYRWGIFLLPPEADKRIGFGEHKSDPVWPEVPGEYRSTLRRIIVTQGDTEPASVEQQRHLGLSCPSLYDLRNLFQVNVEEGRHLWAMAYLLHAHFGRDGREEAEALLARRSGDADNPRILTAFNEKTPDWLSFFMFTFATDRDGKFQLSALAESAFDPLARSCRFMLTEEAHHMFIGESGIARVIQRSCEVMCEQRTDDPARLRALGVIDLATIQKYLNFHLSVTLDLFGAELSSNAASFYTNGLKGRFEEGKIADDHRLGDACYPVMEIDNGHAVSRDAPALAALNERLRDDWFAEVRRAVERWNRIPEQAGLTQRLTVPHKGFHRRIGVFADHQISPDGRLLTEQEWASRVHDWLPTEADRAYVCSLMGRVTEPGRFANWIAPPARGVNSQPLDFAYVRFD